MKSIYFAIMFILFSLSAEASGPKSACEAIRKNTLRFNQCPNVDLLNTYQNVGKRICRIETLSTDLLEESADLGDRNKVLSSVAMIHSMFEMGIAGMSAARFLPLIPGMVAAGMSAADAISEKLLNARAFIGLTSSSVGVVVGVDNSIASSQLSPLNRQMQIDESTHSGFKQSQVLYSLKEKKFADARVNTQGLLESYFIKHYELFNITATNLDRDSNPDSYVQQLKNGATYTWRGLHVESTRQLVEKQRLDDHLALLGQEAEMLFMIYHQSQKSCRDLSQTARTEVQSSKVSRQNVKEAQYWVKQPIIEKKFLPGTTNPAN